MTRIITIILLVSTVSSCAWLFPKTVTTANDEEDYSGKIDGLTLGSGWDSQLSQKKASCVRIKASAVLPIKSSTPSQEVSMTKVTSFDELTEKFTSSVSAAYDNIQNKGDGGIVSFANGDYSTYKTYARLSNVITYLPSRELSINDFELTEEAESFLDSDSGLAIFDAICGDKFIVSLHEGGKFEATLEISDSSTEEQERTKTNLSASSTNGSFSSQDITELKRLQSSMNLKLQLNSSPAIPKLPNTIDIESVVNEWENYLAVVQNSKQKKIVSFEAQDYKPLILKYYSESDLVLASIPKWVSLTKENLNYLLSLSRFKGDLIYMRDNPEQFVYHDNHQLEKAITNISKSIREISLWGYDCIRTRGVDCQDNIVVKDIPPSPLRGNEGKEIDPMTNKYQEVGVSSNSDNILEITGVIGIAKDHERYYSALYEDITFVKFTSLISGVSSEHKALGRLDVPPNTNVFYKFNDHQLKNNSKHPNKNKRGRFRLGETVKLGQWL